MKKDFIDNLSDNPVAFIIIAFGAVVMGYTTFILWCAILRLI